ILAGVRDFAEDEKRPEVFDFDRDMRLADIARAQLRADHTGEFARRFAARLNRSDQRHGDTADTVDGVSVRKAVLPEDDDAQAVAGVERVGGFEGRIDSL